MIFAWTWLWRSTERALWHTFLTWLTLTSFPCSWLLWHWTFLSNQGLIRCLKTCAFGAKVSAIKILYCIVLYNIFFYLESYNNLITIFCWRKIVWNDELLCMCLYHLYSFMFQLVQSRNIWSRVIYGREIVLIFNMCFFKFEKYHILFL